MMRRTLLAFVLLTTFGLSGCSDENLDPALFATWQVTKVEGLVYFNNTPTFPVTADNVSGTVKFEDDGTGYQNYAFQIAGSTYQQVGAFKWTATDDEIIIDLVDEPDMVWKRDANLTNKQVATYTRTVDANQKWDYTLTLEK